MVSQKQLAANRLNAQKSTGPRTDAGKAVSSKNALKHGLTADQCAVLPGEDAAAFERFRDAVIADLNPQGVMQREIVEDIAQTRWKIRRIPQIEAEICLKRQEDARKTHASQVEFKEVPPDSLPATARRILAAAFHWSDNPFALVELYRMRLTRAMHTALRELRKLREETGGGEESGSTCVPPVPEDANETEHGRDARATDEGKNEPDSSCKSWPDMEKGNDAKLRSRRATVLNKAIDACQIDRLLR